MRYNSRHWAGHLLDIEGSMVREILGRVSLCVLWSAIVVVLYNCVPEYFHGIAIAETAHSLIGVSLGLLLVFRTNTSYDRFWEGRKQWGGIVNESRNIARQMESWMAPDLNRVRLGIRWSIEFCFALKHRLRVTSNDRPTPEGIADEDFSAARSSRNGPLAITRKLTQLVHQARLDGLIDAEQQRAIDQNIGLLVDYAGACDRIKSTPAPFAYIVHLRRALILYCLTLPLVLVQKFNWETIVCTLVISYFMFGIEEIGVEIENPFGITVNDLQLEAICDTIHDDLLWILQSNSSEMSPGGPV